eukprot:672235-Prorocentrum_minimum.AAC.4
MWGSVWFRPRRGECTRTQSNIDKVINSSNLHEEDFLGPTPYGFKATPRHVYLPLSQGSYFGRAFPSESRSYGSLPSPPRRQYPEERGKQHPRKYSRQVGVVTFALSEDALAFATATCKRNRTVPRTCRTHECALISLFWLGKRPFVDKTPRTAPTQRPTEHGPSSRRVVFETQAQSSRP